MSPWRFRAAAELAIHPNGMISRPCMLSNKSPGPRGKPELKFENAGWTGKTRRMGTSDLKGVPFILGDGFVSIQ